METMVSKCDITNQRVMSLRLWLGLRVGGALIVDEPEKPAHCEQPGNSNESASLVLILETDAAWRPAQV